LNATDAPPEGLASYYESTYPRLWSYLRRLVPDAAAASDLAQEAFVRLLGSKRVALPEAERTAYLFTIATNLARRGWKDLKRDEQRRAEVRIDESHANDVVAVIDVSRALDTLSARERSIVWLAYAEGHDHRTIAGMVGVREVSIKVLLHRARKKLLTILGGDS